jgi:hypothetical protein
MTPEFPLQPSSYIEKIGHLRILASINETHCQCSCRSNSMGQILWVIASIPRQRRRFAPHPRSISYPALHFPLIGEIQTAVGGADGATAELEAVAVRLVGGCSVEVLVASMSSTNMSMSSSFARSCNVFQKVIKAQLCQIRPKLSKNILDDVVSFALDGD